MINDLLFSWGEQSLGITFETFEKMDFKNGICLASPAAEKQFKNRSDTKK